MMKLMGKLVFAFMICCSLAFSAQAHAQQWASKMFSVKNHDFGVVAKGGKAEFRFVCNNIYVEDVHIANVRSSCGCTTATIEKPTLKTHEEGAILAHFNSDRFLGSKGATITVTIDKPFYAEVRLKVKGYIRSDVVFRPGSVEVGSVPAGHPVTRTVQLDYSGKSDWKITALKSANPHIKATAREVRRNYGQVAYQLDVTVDADAPPGYLNDQIVITTNDYQRSQVPLLVEGVIQAPLVVSPSPLKLGMVRHGEKVTKPIVIRGPKPFRITSISSSGSHFQFGEVDSESKMVHTVPVTFLASDSESGKIADQIHIQTDLNNEEDFTASVIILPDSMLQSN